MNNELNEFEELGPETMTVDSVSEEIEESVSDDVQDEHIGKKTCLVLETPGGDTTICLNGDFETNLLVVDLISEALEARYSRDIGQVNFYSKPCNSLNEDEFLGQQTKFASNSVGAMIGLLQKTGDMNDILITKCIPSNVPIMPVKIERNNGVVALDFTEGTPALDTSDIQD